MEIGFWNLYLLTSLVMSLKGPLPVACLTYLCPLAGHPASGSEQATVVAPNWAGVGQALVIYLILWVNVQLEVRSSVVEGLIIAILNHVPLRHHFRTSQFAYILSYHKAPFRNKWMSCFHLLSWFSEDLVPQVCWPSYDGGVTVGCRLRGVLYPWWQN